MPSYKIKKGVVDLGNGKTAGVGDSVEVSEETAKAHPDVFDLGGEEDARLYPDDGTKKEDVDERTKRVRAEAIRAEAIATPPPPTKGKDGKPLTGAAADAARTAQTLEQERARSAAVEDAAAAGTTQPGLMDRLRHRKGGRDGGGEGGGQ